MVAQLRLPCARIFRGRASAGRTCLRITLPPGVVGEARIEGLLKNLFVGKGIPIIELFTVVTTPPRGCPTGRDLSLQNHRVFRRGGPVCPPLRKLTFEIGAVDTPPCPLPQGAFPAAPHRSPALPPGGPFPAQPRAAPPRISPHLPYSPESGVPLSCARRGKTISSAWAGIKLQCERAFSWNRGFGRA